ncbi:hypothetical protein HP567_017950 [Brevibacillus sp. M2.1A]|uniref:hypothetical protein n=1 Tax=Brevibacillus TaxID=55080 RepID=UPI00156B8322|nr:MULTISPECIES: hypothetical protein [Brevibacillus]MBY0084026.1 hypothetical protein [Brevibacillus brevis]MCC8436431.1 hypothetical protein [Brevibacillus sp. M2.1A]MCE0448426.1 hypothetical protein [Brevibacillus sp. AF8]
MYGWYPQEGYYPISAGEGRHYNDYELLRHIARLERRLAEVQEALSACTKKNDALKKDLEVVRQQSTVQTQNDQTYQQPAVDKVNVKCIAATGTSVTFEISGRSLTFDSDYYGKYVGDYTPGKVYVAMADYGAGQIYLTIKDDNEIWHTFRYSRIQS